MRSRLPMAETCLMCSGNSKKSDVTRVGRARVILTVMEGRRSSMGDEGMLQGHFEQTCAFSFE